MLYPVKDYSALLGLKGFSEPLLKNHFALYEGYVKNANRLIEVLTRLLEEGKTGEPNFSEIKRRLAFELNGIKLHEYYFENMGKQTQVELGKDNLFYKKITQEFGSYQKWVKSFQAVAAMRGVGWAVAIYDASTGFIINTWVDEHHIGHVAGTTPILILDLWEHAMLLDYGSDRKKYIEAFFNVIDWNVVSSRLEKALEPQEIHQH